MTRRKKREKNNFDWTLVLRTGFETFFFRLLYNVEKKEVVDSLNQRASIVLLGSGN